MDERDLYQDIRTQDGGYFYGEPYSSSGSTFARLPAPFTGGRQPNPKFGAWGNRFDEERRSHREILPRTREVMWQQRDRAFANERSQSKARARSFHSGLEEMETEEASEEQTSREGVSETEKAMEVGLDKAGGTIRFSSSMDWEENENSTMDWAKTSAENNSDGTSGTEEEQFFAAEKNQGGQTEEAFSVRFENEEKKPPPREETFNFFAAEGKQQEEKEAYSVQTEEDRVEVVNEGLDRIEKILKVEDLFLEINFQPIQL